MRMHLTCLIKTVTAEGQPMYTYKPLKTDIEKLPMFVAGLKLKHRLDEDSPIRNFRNVGDARNLGILAFYALIEGTEEVYGKPIFARHAYKADTVMFGYHFGQMLVQNDQGGGLSPIARVQAHVPACTTASHLQPVPSSARVPRPPTPQPSVHQPSGLPQPRKHSSPRLHLRLTWRLSYTSCGVRVPTPIGHRARVPSRSVE